MGVLKDEQFADISGISNLRLGLKKQARLLKSTVIEKNGYREILTWGLDYIIKEGAIKHDTFCYDFASFYDSIKEKEASELGLIESEYTNKNFIQYMLMKSMCGTTGYSPMNLFINQPNIFSGGGQRNFLLKFLETTREFFSGLVIENTLYYKRHMYLDVLEELEKTVYYDVFNISLIDTTFSEPLNRCLPELKKLFVIYSNFDLSTAGSPYLMAVKILDDIVHTALSTMTTLIGLPEEGPIGYTEEYARYMSRRVSATADDKRINEFARN